MDKNDDSKKPLSDLIIRLLEVLNCKRASLYELFNTGALDSSKPFRDIVEDYYRRKYQGAGDRARLYAAQAEKNELEVLEKKGQVVSTAAVLELLKEIFATIASGMDGVPGRMASELAGLNDAGTIRIRLLSELRAARAGCVTALQAFVANLPRPDDDLNGAEPAAGQDAGGVDAEQPRVAKGKRGARAVPTGANALDNPNTKRRRKSKV